MQIEPKIVYEDNHIIVVIKPHNIAVQEDSSKDEDMLTIIKNYIKERDNKPGNVFLGLVHRLDRPTGGVMVFAKTSKAAERLSEQLKNKQFSKKYIAVTDGKPKHKAARLEHFLLKDELNNKVTVCPRGVQGAKQAILEFDTIATKGDYGLVNVKILTGRSHQIRVQFATIGCPLLGDVKYNKNQKTAKNLALWAYELSFVHPTTKKQMIFKCIPNTDSMPWKAFEKEILNLQN